jgi:hypothetical protein
MPFCVAQPGCLTGFPLATRRKFLFGGASGLTESLIRRPIYGVRVTFNLYRGLMAVQV